MAENGKTYKVESGKLPKNLDSIFRYGPFTLDISSLEEVRTKLGGGEIFTSGSAGSFEARVCFVDSDGNGVAFIAGEFHGGKYVGSIEAVSNRRLFSKKISCAPLKTKFESLSPSSGFWVGASKAKIQEIIGRPGYESKKFWIYSLSGALQEKLWCGKEATGNIDISIELNFARDHVSRMSIWETDEGENPCVGRDPKET